MTSGSGFSPRVYTKVFNRTGPALTLRYNEGILGWFPKLEFVCPARTPRTSTPSAPRSET